MTFSTSIKEGPESGNDSTLNAPSHTRAAAKGTNLKIKSSASESDGGVPRQSEVKFGERDPVPGRGGGYESGERRARPRDTDPTGKARSPV